MMATKATRESALADIDDIFGELSLEVSDQKLLTTTEKKSKVAQFVQGLLTLLPLVCHGDIKPPNILWNNDRFDIADFGASIKFSDTLRKMNPAFRLSGEDEKCRTVTFLNIFCSPNSDSTKVEAACRRCAATVQKLVEWKIFTQDAAKTPPIICDQTKLTELRAYLKSEFLPAKSDGYASNQYLTTMCDYFWRCDADNFVRACNAFDIRAAGITISAIFTGAHAPKNEHDKKFYDDMEQSLRAMKISDCAISIIRRMAEPIQNMNTSQGTEFVLPVTYVELEQLKVQMSL